MARTRTVSHSEIEQAWLAGLLEGEGDFGLRRRSKDNVMQPRIKLQMCDRDVVERAAALMGGNTVHKVSARKEGWRDSWKLIVTGWPALDIMALVRPYMGLRRGARIDGMLSGDYARTATRKGL